ncbi:MAG TPA: acyltransferase [Candidatus Dormibacteraeota bacterium]
MGAGRRSRSRNIDALRAVAALMVVCAHANYLNDATRAPSAEWRHYLWSGVNLFFVLSGYLIARPFVAALLERSPLPRTGAFAIRRAFRILPAYWLVLLAVLVLTPPVGLRLSDLAAHALLVHDVVPGDAYTIHSVAWTLGIEAMFYVAVPIAAHLVARRWPAITARRLVTLVLAVWVASALFSLVVATFGEAWIGVARDLTVNDAGDRPPSILTLGLPAKLYLFCPGILVAVAERSGALRRGMSRLDGVPALRVCTAGIGVAVALWLLGVAADGSGASSLGHALRDEVFGLGFGLLLVIALWSPAWRSPPARALAAIGVVSYGLYLWHPVTEELLRERHLVALPWAATCVVLALAGLVPAAVSWFAVERPALARAAVLTAAPAPRVARAADTPVPAAARR